MFLCLIFLVPVLLLSESAVVELTFSGVLTSEIESSKIAVSRKPEFYLTIRNTRARHGVGKLAMF